MPFPFCCCGSGSSSSSFPRISSSAPRLRRSTLQATANNLTKIFEELKCPVCFNICVPPIHNCINGHIICNTCRQKGHFTSCPTCRHSLSSGSRNIFAENFVMNYAQQCCYASQGCEHLRLKGCNMKPHEEKCMFRPILCIIGSCRLHIPYKSFLAHLDCGHKVLGTDQLPAQIQFNYKKKSRGCPRWLPYYIQAYGNLYYVMMQRVGKLVWVWVYYQLAKESEDLEYAYHAYIKLKHPDKKVSISWHGPVHSVRTPFKTIQAEGCSFSLPSSLVKNFLGKGGLNFTVDIRKVPRRSLKGVKLSGDGDSETAVVAGALPAEYNRPPSFYEPNNNNTPPIEQPPPEFSPPGQQGNQAVGCQGEICFSPLSPHISLSSSVLLGASPTSKDTTIEEDQISFTVSRRKPARTAAIGIPNVTNALQLSETSTVTSFLDNTPQPEELLGMGTSNDESGDVFGDKVAAYLQSCTDIQKSFCSVQKQQK